MKVLSNILYYLFIAGIALVGMLLLATIMPIPGNIKAKIVKSGSMEPAIQTGGLVIIIPQESYDVGDVITFGKDTKTQIPTTHRIIAVNGDGPLRTFTTQGDANDAPDPIPTRLSEISGKVIFDVPYLGYLLDFAKKPLGFVLLVGIPAGIVIVDEISKIFKEVSVIKRKKRNGTEENYNQESNQSTG